MNNNDILRRICYIFDFNESKIVSVCSLADFKVPQDLVSGWLKNKGDPDFQECRDIQLVFFLNGLINDRRGKKEGPLPTPERHINNNIILKKLKIALDLKADDILEILELADLHMSKHELSAFFRKPGHKHYRDCKDPNLLGFLNGVQLKYRDNKYGKQ